MLAAETSSTATTMMPALEGCEVTVTDAALSRFLVRRRVGHDTLLSPAKTS